MTKFLRCDVCDKDYQHDPEEVFWGEFKLPATWLPAYAEDDADQMLSLDICSIDCLFALAKVLNNEEEEEPSGRPEPDNEDIPEPMQLPEVTVR